MSACPKIIDSLGGASRWSRLRGKSNVVRPFSLTREAFPKAWTKIGNLLKKATRFDQAMRWARGDRLRAKAAKVYDKVARKHPSPAYVPVDLIAQRAARQAYADDRKATAASRAAFGERRREEATRERAAAGRGK